MGLTFVLTLALFLLRLVEGGSKQKEPMTLSEDQGSRLTNLQNQTKVPLRFSCDNVTRICAGDFTECRKSYCHCHEGYAPRYDNPDICAEKVYYYHPNLQTDPTMIGVVIGLVLMSVTMCVVLRLFAKARFRENRTIFNTPNPRLMNASLMKDSKHFFRGNSASGQDESRRRGSQTSENSQINEETPRLTSQPVITPFSVGEDVSRLGRTKVLKQQSTETGSAGGGGSGETPMAGSSTSGGGGGPLPLPRFPKGKYRQDSVTSNSNV